MIKINDEFYVDSDVYQYIIKQKNVSKETGKEYFIPIAYIGSVEKCVEHVMKLQQRRICQKDLPLSVALDEFKIINKEMQTILESIRKDEVL